LALKQLLELPNISPKKNNLGAPKKSKKATKSALNRDSHNQAELKFANSSKTEIINLDSTEEDSPKKDNKTLKSLKENHNQNTRSSTASAIALSVEESRSGRKRKLTEKAREHELTVKRQKVSST
jgi:response regulator of citrate/malate metabolism